MSFLFNLLKVFIPFIFYSAFKGVIALRQLLKMANASSLSLSAFFSRLDTGFKGSGGFRGSFTGGSHFHCHPLLPLLDDYGKLICLPRTLWLLNDATRTHIREQEQPEDK